MSIRLRRPHAFAALLISGAVGANLAFLGLGKVFDYPDVLDEPPADVLASFAAHRPAVVALFTLLLVSAALLAPIGVLLGRWARTPRAGRAIAATGVFAAAVQVAGLARWPLVVPFVHDPDTFHTLNLVLGRAIGETVGYAATAVFTVLVVRELTGRHFGRVTAVLGIASAALVACGVLVPLSVPGADLANFVGYVLWSGWLLALAAERVPQRTPATQPSIASSR
ncbi:MAG TPA: DUF4386 family protein [Actinophytocola sp.]|jgi:hypothetical protein|uniref:DUF4386 family protein n=1 Tax=Actinophytocola sp. TaxID=1872138 RepID=UPI002F944DD0